MNELALAQLRFMALGMGTTPSNLIAYLIWRYQTEEDRKELDQATLDRLIVFSEENGLTLNQAINYLLDKEEGNQTLSVGQQEGHN